MCRFYSLAEIRNHASPWSPAISQSDTFPSITPTHEIHTRWQHELPALVQGELVPHTVWVLPQWWPTFADVPLRTSTIILYISATADRSLARTRTWRAVQHYSYASGPGPAGSGGEGGTVRAGPCTDVRCVVEIDDPVLIPLGEHGLPILAHSFNHLGWIEEREVELDFDGDMEEDFREASSSSSLSTARQRLSSLIPSIDATQEKLVNLVSSMTPFRNNSNISRKRKGKNSKGKSAERVLRRRRALKMVTFPDPGVSPIKDETFSTKMRTVTLDVPEHVLNEAYHIFIDPAVGTVTVATISNALHVFPYS